MLAHERSLRFGLKVTRSGSHRLFDHRPAMSSGPLSERLGGP